MMETQPPFSIHINIWLETAEGEVAISPWRMHLLETVAREGSISAAAKAMHIQYRLAWQRIHEMEERLGMSLVETTIGGRGGGGARLTPQAQRLIEHVRTMFDAIEACAQEQGVAQLRHLEEIFHS